MRGEVTRYPLFLILIIALSPVLYSLGSASSERIYFREDFDGYSDGQDLLETTRWSEDTHRPYTSSNAQFTASVVSRSSVIGTIYNPSTGYSYILSPELNISKGVLRCDVATDTMYSGSASMSVSFSLIGGGGERPENDDRVVSVQFRNMGIAYRIDTVDPQNVGTIVDSGIRANTWYGFKVAFDCEEDKADIWAYDASGELLGSVTDVDLMTSAESVSRIELITTRDHDGVYTTSYWDNITLRNTGLEEKDDGCRIFFLPGFEISLMFLASALVLMIGGLRRKLG